ncbi:6-phospho-beta-glucosidase [Mesoplasma florum]|uniref:glycoside hydrolase family 1 protein n=1 Tax=Mesoplasma florum TaxID=2151 RepID=UPI000D04187E|nr:glycoside hydrolase family 1 protein [Mesoplasma florum]AVN63681.1 6-phospho-beta-glucosidase [Mesoplasma florum]
MKIKFKKDFMWGTATSGPQTEGFMGKKEKNIMDYWFEKNPEDFYSKVGPTLTSDFYSNYEKDVEMMSQIGLNSFRTSIQWTRIYNDVETEEINQNGVQFYRNYFKELKNKNIKLIVNLFHFDMPIKFEKKGGFTNNFVIDKYVSYAKKCFELFGDLVDLWSTFNEPIVPVECCYIYGLFYPKIKNLNYAIQAGYGTILAHSKVVNVFHDLFSNDKNKKISIILNVTPTYPATNEPKDIKSAEIRDMIFNKVFLDACVKGIFSDELVNFLKDNSLLPNYSVHELEIIKKSKIDFLGVNYYQPGRVKEALKENMNSQFPNKWFEEYIWPERRINPYRGWEIHPETIYNIAMNIKNEYDNIPWFISENGIGVENENRFEDSTGFINDQYRIDFVKEHLFWLNKAISEGSNCFGYHMWTFIDCWSWANAYKNRYGLISLNLVNQKRTMKKSALFFKELSLNNSFEYNINEILKTKDL